MAPRKKCEDLPENIAALVNFRDDLARAVSKYTVAGSDCGFSPHEDAISKVNYVRGMLNSFLDTWRLTHKAK